jgi:hypothetical protein
MDNGKCNGTLTAHYCSYELSLHTNTIINISLSTGSLVCAFYAQNHWENCIPVTWQYLCHTSVFMTLWHTHTSIHDITTKYPKPAELAINNLFSRNKSHSHDNLRRVSKSPLLHPFTCHRSDTLDWCVTKATSADSSRLIHTILAHSSIALFYCTLLLFYISLSFNLLSP